MKPVKNFENVLDSTYHKGPQITIRKADDTPMFLNPYSGGYHSKLDGECVFWIMDKKEWDMSHIRYVMLVAINWEKETIEYGRIEKQRGVNIDKMLYKFHVPNMEKHFLKPESFFTLIENQVSEIWKQFINN